MTDDELLDSGNRVGRAFVVESIRRVRVSDRYCWKCRAICYDEGPMMIACHGEENVVLIADVACVVYITMKTV